MDKELSANIERLINKLDGKDYAIFINPKEPEEFYVFNSKCEFSNKPFALPDEFTQYFVKPREIFYLKYELGKDEANKILKRALSKTIEGETRNGIVLLYSEIMINELKERIEKDTLNPFHWL